MSTEFNKISEEALEQVSGGVRRIVDTGTSQNAAVREGAGKGYEQIASLKNGTAVNATGKFKLLHFRIISIAHDGVAGNPDPAVTEYSRQLTDTTARS